MPAIGPHHGPTDESPWDGAAARSNFYAGFGPELRTANETRCVREMDPTIPRFTMRSVPNGTGGEALRFTGYASVVDKPYDMYDMFGPYTETIARNAFNKTLSDGADVNFLCNHEGVSLARTKSGSLRLSADDTGLYSEATFNPSRPDVQIVRAAVEDGDLDEMSFAFRATRQEWDDDHTQREIQEVNMHQGDVSVVNFGASPHTAGLVAMRSRWSARPTRPSRPLILPDYGAEARHRVAVARGAASRPGRGVHLSATSRPGAAIEDARRRLALARARGR